MAEKTGLVDFWKQSFMFTEKEIAAFISVKREDFITEKYRDAAYSDVPLPILRGKTISQPTTVMVMTHALEVKAGMKIFEVGTGSGYQTAILAKLAGVKGVVISTEVIPELVNFAKDNLKKAGIENARIFEEDGSRGMESEAPFDRIIITAACKEIPKPLIGQLKPGGIIIAPVGSDTEQQMVKAAKSKDGKMSFEFLGSFVFSSLYGKYGFED